MRLAEHIKDSLRKLIRPNRLAQIIDGAELHGLHRIFHLSVVSHDKERDRIIFIIQPFQKEGTVSIRQTQVCQYQIVFLFPNGFLRIGKFRYAFHPHALFYQPVTDGTAENNIVFYNQNTFHCFSSCNLCSAKSIISFIERMISCISVICLFVHEPVAVVTNFLNCING